MAMTHARTCILLESLLEVITLPVSGCAQCSDGGNR